MSAEVTLAELTARYPGIRWGEPIKLTIPGGTWLGCRARIAISGLPALVAKPSGSAPLYATLPEWTTHMVAVHGWAPGERPS